MDEGDSAGTFAQLLDHLFTTVHPPGRGPYTYAEVSQAIQNASAPEERGVSASAIQQLRTGQKANPTRYTIKALADFFGVPASYFFDEEVAERTKAEIELTAAMSDAGVRRIALRAKGLSPESLRMLTTVIDQARHWEGLPEGAPAPEHDLNLDD
ncbi:Secondary metabolite protein [Streptomyces nanshensis]|nr:Secondary metabolite protein [Streptomyces nanshensis]